MVNRHRQRRPYRTATWVAMAMATEVVTPKVITARRGPWIYRCVEAVMSTITPARATVTGHLLPPTAVTIAIAAAAAAVAATARPSTHRALTRVRAQIGKDVAAEMMTEQDLLMIGITTIAAMGAVAAVDRGTITGITPAVVTGRARAMAPDVESTTPTRVHRRRLHRLHRPRRLDHHHITTSTVLPTMIGMADTMPEEEVVVVVVEVTLTPEATGIRT